MFSGWVYILTNNHNTVLYVGATNNLPTRLWEHRTKRNPKCFTAKYNLHKLVYYKGFELVVEAIATEKMMKGKSHQWKCNLIESVNPEWLDLTDEVSKLWASS